MRVMHVRIRGSTKKRVFLQTTNPALQTSMLLLPNAWWYLVYSVIAVDSFLFPHSSAGEEICLGCRRDITSKSGDVDGRKCKTRPKVDAVSLNRLGAVGVAEACCRSMVVLEAEVTAGDVPGTAGKGLLEEPLVWQ